MFAAASASLFGADRQDYSYKYVVRVTNGGEEPVAVDLTLVPSEENRALQSGFYGLLVPPGQAELFALPDFKWKGWGGPRRVLKHLQDHPIHATVRRFGKDASEPMELKPGSHLRVGGDGHEVEHVDLNDAAKEELWAQFVASDQPDKERYSYAYAMRAQNQHADIVWLDMMVPNTAEKACPWPVGIRGFALMPAGMDGADRTVVVPDFSWLAKKGPFTVSLHIQDHPIEVTVHKDQEEPGSATTLEVGNNASINISTDGAVALAGA